MLQWGSRQPSSHHPRLRLSPRAHVRRRGRIWVGDNNNAVMAFHTDGTFVHRYGSQRPAAGQFKGGVQASPSRVYATDVAGCRLQVFDEAKLLQGDQHCKRAVRHPGRRPRRLWHSDWADDHSPRHRGLTRTVEQPGSLRRGQTDRFRVKGATRGRAVQMC
jgi:hypothetical protein